MLLSFLQYIIRGLFSKLVLLFLFFYFVLGVSTSRGQGSSAIQNDSLEALQYNQQALRLLNEYRLSESETLIRKALAKKENAVSYYLLSHIDNIEEKWDEAIVNGEKSRQIAPDFMPVYTELFNAYSGAKKWTSAISVSDNALKSDQSGYVAMQLKAIENNLYVEDISREAVISLLLVLCGFLFIPLYRSSRTSVVTDCNVPRLSEILLGVSFISCLLWIIFYAFSKKIWSSNPHYEPFLIMAPVRQFLFEHDGAESFVLYGIMFANIILSSLLVSWLRRFKLNTAVYITLCTILLVTCGYYFFHIQFIPPVAATGGGLSSNTVVLLFKLAIIAIGLYVFHIKFPLVSKVIFVVLIMAVTLVGIYPSSLFDLSFVLDPALRIKYGAKLSDIYFQYDVFLSLIAVVWLKLSLSLSSFAYLAQVSFFLFFVSIFLFADRLFKTKGLAVFFIVAIVLVRFYAVMEQGVNIFQVSPLRLDLWIIPLLFAWKKGFQHWLVGLSLGMLVIFHRNLGLIYLGSYIEMLVVIFLFEAIPIIKDKKPGGIGLYSLFVKYLRLNLLNILLVGGSIVVCFVLFGGLFSASALIYRTLGIGMLPISNNSFYWYVPVLLSTTLIFIVYYRTKFSAQYINTSLFAVFLAIGNSMYFFGRSHENNILNISGILVLVLFILFDALIFTVDVNKTVVATVVAKNAKVKVDPVVKKKYFLNRQYYVALPLTFILLAGFYYSDTITAKTDAQSDNLKAGQYIYPITEIPVDTASINRLTHSTQKVYFLDLQYDFYDYYYGNYAPLGYFSPAGAWVFKKDFLTFLQGLLDDHYYIICRASDMNGLDEYLPYLDYNQSARQGGVFALSKTKVNMLLPIDTMTSQFHAAYPDSMLAPGLEHANVKVQSDFTIELVIKPDVVQVANATIISEMSQYDGIKGFTFQQNGSQANQYVFAYSIGASVVNTLLSIESDQWHYIVLEGSKSTLKVYDNGKIITTLNTNGNHLVNTEMPLIIANNASKNAHFSGDIREVNIGRGNLAESEITSRAAKIASSLTIHH